MTIKDLINTCNTMIDPGSMAHPINFDDFAETIKVAINVFSHIDDFIEECGSEWAAYPEEYFEDNRNAAQRAIKSFINILYELGEYVDD